MPKRSASIFIQKLAIKGTIDISQQMLPRMGHKNKSFCKGYIYMNNAQRCKCIFIQNSLLKDNMSIKIHFGQQMFPHKKAKLMTMGFFRQCI